MIGLAIGDLFTRGAAASVVNIACSGAVAAS
jgi:hypothetical protein